MLLRSFVILVSHEHYEMPEQQYSLTLPFHLSAPRLPSHFWTHSFGDRMFMILSKVVARRSLGVGLLLGCADHAPRRPWQHSGISRRCLHTRQVVPLHFGVSISQLPYGQSSFHMQKVYRRVTVELSRQPSIRTFSTEDNGECVCCMCVCSCFIVTKTYMKKQAYPVFKTVFVVICDAIPSISTSWP